MKHPPARIGRFLTGAALTLLAAAPAVQGQSADALIDKLVDKGILTVKEANDLREETDKNFNSAYQVKSGMPDWVTSLKINGDFRGRFERNTADNDAYSDRSRFRYRMRLGVVASLVDNFEVGVRLASGNPLSGGAINGSPGGSPVTANQDLNSLESRKWLWIDAAYAKWTPINNKDWIVNGTIGKMDNPFTLSNMVWDYDINPEGGAFQVIHNLGSKHALRGTGAFFVLDELNQVNSTVPTIRPSQDPYLYGGQLLLESKWAPKFETALGVAVFNVVHSDSLSAVAQPFYNAGNTRKADGLLVYNMNPIVGSASATYRLDSFPLYTGSFPVRVLGEYMDNPAAANNNIGYRVGFAFGKAGHKQTWEVNYRYQRLEADAWFDALVDDDNGGFYAKGNPQLANTPKSSGWFGGTNVRGHLVQATYSFTDYLNFTFTYYLNDLIINAPNQSSDASHFMADLMWKF